MPHSRVTRQISNSVQWGSSRTMFRRGTSRKGTLTGIRSTFLTDRFMVRRSSYPVLRNPLCDGESAVTQRGSQDRLLDHAHREERDVVLDLREAADHAVDDGGDQVGAGLVGVFRDQGAEALRPEPL